MRWGQVTASVRESWSSQLNGWSSGWVHLYRTHICIFYIFILQMAGMLEIHLIVARKKGWTFGLLKRGGLLPHRVEFLLPRGAPQLPSPGSPQQDDLSCSRAAEANGSLRPPCQDTFYPLRSCKALNFQARPPGGEEPPDVVSKGEGAQKS